MAEKRSILSEEAAAHKMRRLALEVAEELNGDTTPLIIIGILSSGMVIAEKIGRLLAPLQEAPITVISASLDKNHPAAVTLSSTPDFSGKNILIADDVTNSGKTLLYALGPLLKFHPKSIRTLVLVERMHKLFPVKPDHVGLSVATAPDDIIQVEVVNGEVMGAFLA